MTDAPDEPERPDPTRRPDYEDFRDPASKVVDWAAFRAAVVAYDPDASEVPTQLSGG